MRTRVVVLAFLVTAVPSRPLHAGDPIDWRHYGIQCYVGPFTACASLSISLMALSEANGTSDHSTLLTLRFSNKQGSPGFDYGGFSGLRSIVLRGLATDITTSFNRGFLESGTFLSGNSGGEFFIRTHYLTGGDEEPSLVVDHDAGIGYPIWGCSIPPRYFDLFKDEEGNPISPGFTCGKDAFQQWQIQLPGTFAFTKTTETEFRWLGGPQENALQGASCIADVTCIATVPEPGTLVLFGTAAASLGLWRRRRREIERRAREHPSLHG